MACAQRELSRWNAADSTGKNKLRLKYCENTSPCYPGEWCAGFVSYIYRVAGYPFKNGTTFLAYGVQHASGFARASNAQRGDIQIDTGAGGFGHTMIVERVSGTNTPHFISGNYGNAVTRTDDNSGFLYYLTPN